MTLQPCGSSMARLFVWLNTKMDNFAFLHQSPVSSTLTKRKKKFNLSECVQFSFNFECWWADGGEWKHFSNHSNYFLFSSNFHSIGKYSNFLPFSSLKTGWRQNKKINNNNNKKRMAIDERLSSMIGQIIVPLSFWFHPFFIFNLLVKNTLTCFPN